MARTETPAHTASFLKNIIFVHSVCMLRSEIEHVRVHLTLCAISPSSPCKQQNSPARPVTAGVSTRQGARPRLCLHKQGEWRSLSWAPKPETEPLRATRGLRSLTSFLLRPINCLYFHTTRYRLILGDKPKSSGLFHLFVRILLF